MRHLSSTIDAKYQPQRKAKIGFIGVGAMGSVMVRHLLDADYDVYIHDLNKKVIGNLLRCGAKHVEDLKSIGSSCDQVFTMLPSTEAISLVYNIKDGLLSNPSPDTLFVDFSSSSPDAARAIHKLAETRKAKFYDAPVSGGVRDARLAQLVFMVGGCDDACKDSLESVLKIMGSQIVHCGPIGTGCMTNICNTMMTTISMIGLSEACLLGKNCGLESKVLFDIINSDSGESWCSSVNHPLPGMIKTAPSTDKYKGGHNASHIYDDLNAATKLATDSLVPIPLTAMSFQLFRLLFQTGKVADKDFSVIYQFLDQKK